MSTTPVNKQPMPNSSVQQRRPNEQGTVSVQAHIKIFDPKTQKTYVEGRA